MIRGRVLGPSGASGAVIQTTPRTPSSALGPSVGGVHQKGTCPPRPQRSRSGCGCRRTPGPVGRRNDEVVRTSQGSARANPCRSVEYDTDMSTTSGFDEERSAVPPLHMRSLRVVALLIGIAVSAAAADAGTDGYVRIEGGRFESVRPVVPGQKSIAVPSFLLGAHPVTNAEFLDFVLRRPEWRRGEAPILFVDPDYLLRWASATELGAAAPPDRPVTNVSWFAARAYCAAAGARLPIWHEWEWAAAADETRRDARSDPDLRQLRFDAVARQSGRDLPAVAQGPPNVHGAYDLHGAISEWVEETGSLVMGVDARAPGDSEEETYCGGSLPRLGGEQDDATLVHLALLRSVPPSGAVATVGFRCARDLRPGAP